MKYIFVLLLFINIGLIKGQDIAVVDITLPTYTVCTQTSNSEEIIATMVISSIGTIPTNTLTVTYVISSSSGMQTIVTETLTPLTGGESRPYPFATKADLSAIANYTISVFVSYDGDIDPSNNSFKGYNLYDYVVYSPTKGGTVSPNITVCKGSNSGTLNLVGTVGKVLNWQSSTNGGVTWKTISTNTLTSINYLNVDSVTKYRALVQNGPCTLEYSGIGTIGVSSGTGAGYASANVTVCNGSNSGNINLIGYSGNILNWESSTNGGTSWNTIANTTDVLSYTNVSAPTLYRAVVKSGGCASANSTPAAIAINQPTIGGSVSANATVCSGSNSGTLNLSGHSGTVLNWESSSNGGTTWSSIANSTTTQNYSNLTTTTLYRAKVQNGVCSYTVSSYASISMDPLGPVGGTISANATVCVGTNSGVLTLSGYNGIILNWESSTDNGSTWKSITNTTTTQNYNNLTTTTFYRAKVDNGICAAVSSTNAIITTKVPSVGGSIPSATVCVSGNSGTLNLVGTVGDVVNWESSTNNGALWTPITNTSTSQNYTNLLSTTWYRANVQNGVCAMATSSVSVIKISQPTIAGTVTPNVTLCKGSSGLLTLNGFTGTILNWESSADNGSNWVSIVNDLANYNFNNVPSTTQYRAVVKNEGCPSFSSSSAIITVYPKTLSAGLDTAIDFGKSINLNASGGTNYNWSPKTTLSDFQAASPLASPLITTTYTLVATDLNGCLDVDYVLVEVSPGKFNYQISNLITMNDDGINDYWYIENIEQFPSSEVEVFNINGEKIFSAKPYLNDWYGTYNGKKVSDGVYYYLLKFSDNNAVFKGSITIVSKKR